MNVLDAWVLARVSMSLLVSTLIYTRTDDDLHNDTLGYGIYLYLLVSCVRVGVYT